MNNSILRLLVCILLSFAAAGSEAATTSGKPISVPPSFYWDGNDGPWSSFAIQIGTPRQPVRLFPHSSESSTWTVLEQGCTTYDPSDCPNSRGFVFTPEKSDTWKQEGKTGLYNLQTHLESPLGYGGNAYYGFDTVGLGWGSDVESVSHQVVAGIATKDFYIGSLGLDIRPFNFSSLNNAYPSMLGALTKEDAIPSASWAYTAGSANYAPATYGSLVLGGYDKNRFVSNEVTFPFGSDVSNGLVLAIQKITSDVTGEDQSLLDTPVFAAIDTVVSQMWLPRSVCDSFEKAFGLSYDNKTEMYFITEATHKKLSSSNPSVTFTVSPESTGSNSVRIEMPYSSLALHLTYPYVSDGTKQRYFPIRRAPSSTSIVLGRAFFQNAYIVVDNDRDTFSISEAVFSTSASGLTENLVPIHRPGENNTGSEDSGLSTVAKAGIAVAAVIVALALATLAIFLVRKRRQAPGRKRASTLGSSAPEPANGARSSTYKSNTSSRPDSPSALPTFKAEIDGTPVEGPKGGFRFGSRVDSPSAESPDIEQPGPVEIAGRERAVELESPIVEKKVQGNEELLSPAPPRSPRPPREFVEVFEME